MANLTDLQDLTRQRIIEQHLDSAGRRALAQTCRHFRDEVDQALTLAERYLKSAWRATYNLDDPFIAQLGDSSRLDRPDWSGPMAAWVAALTIALPASATSSDNDTPCPQLDRGQRYRTLRKNFQLACQLFGRLDSLSAAVTDKSGAKVAAYINLSNHPDPWPPSMLSLLATAPFAYGQQMEPPEASEFHRGFLEQQLELYPFLRGENDAFHSSDHLWFYSPTAVHPSCMEGNVMWGVDAHHYLFVAVSGLVESPANSNAPASDTVFTYACHPNRADGRWDRTEYSRLYSQRHYDGMYTVICS